MSNAVSIRSESTGATPTHLDPRSLCPSASTLATTLCARVHVEIAEGIYNMLTTITVEEEIYYTLGLGVLNLEQGRQIYLAS